MYSTNRTLSDDTKVKYLLTLTVTFILKIFILTLLPLGVFAFTNTSCLPKSSYFISKMIYMYMTVYIRIGFMNMYFVR